jgi:hypothetical protein
MLDGLGSVRGKPSCKGPRRKCAGKNKIEENVERKTEERRRE